MSEGPQGNGGWTSDRSAAGGGNPWIIATVVSLSTFMEVLDTSIANVARATSLAVFRRPTTKPPG